MTIPDYRRLFESGPGCCVVLTPELTIVAANDAYLKVTMTRREDIIGLPLFEVFPGNPEGPASTAELDLRASVLRVLATRRPDSLPVHKYAIAQPNSGAFEERHWSPLNVPVFGDDGRVSLIIHLVEDVTEQLRTQRRLRELSTPVVTVRDRVLFLPLIGNVDAQRSEQIMQTVLERVVQDKARVVIIDVAGVPVVDASLADALIKSALAARVLGARTVMTGIGPEMSKTIVSLGVDVSALHTCSRLAEGIELAVHLVERGIGGGVD